MGEANRKVYAEALHQAKDLLDRKQYAEAIAKLDALTAERPRESQARFMKGVALTDQGKADEAMTVFRGILADFPELPEPRNNLAVLYAQKGEYAQARDELERAVRDGPRLRGRAREPRRRLCAARRRRVRESVDTRQAQPHARPRS